MTRISIYPDKISAFGRSGADVFCLVTNSAYVESFKIEPAPSYRQSFTVHFDDGDDFVDLLKSRIPDGAHILTILPDCLLHSIPREILGRRKLLIMACRSGRTDLHGVEHFLRAGERTVPEEQQVFADRFFERGEASEFMEIVNDELGISARFDHQGDEYEWHEQLGELSEGDQQVFPAGEIACFLVPLDVQRLQPKTRFAINGQIALAGGSIVQSGPPSFLAEDQERIYQQLATMKDHPVIVDIVDGDVTALTATDATCVPAAKMLQSLFDVDSRFRRIYEVGFAINRHFELWPGNSAMNEVYGGSAGIMHLGLGMLPHTQYHIDIFCVGTRVLGKGGETIFGQTESTAGSKMKRQRSAACPCVAY